MGQFCGTARIYCILYMNHGGAIRESGQACSGFLHAHLPQGGPEGGGDDADERDARVVAAGQNDDFGC